MKKSDIQVIAGVLVVIAAFCFVPGALDKFSAVTKSYPYMTSFLKFAALATFGESLGLRISAGVYNRPGFGLLPRAFVWGILGLTIKMAFSIFANGVPFMLAEAGVPVSLATLKDGSFYLRLICSFSISVTMNLIFAPVMMTVHKITDSHIAATNGTMQGLFSAIPMGKTLKDINWDVMWNFVLKKTIPFFWIPAHTITFLLPPHLQIIFAALLGVALGVILAIASLKPREKSSL